MKRSLVITVAGILLMYFLLISVSSAWKESLTFDEIVHIEEGYHAWVDHTFQIDTNNPPLIRELAVFPLIFMSSINSSTIPNISMFPARFVIIILGILLGVAVFAVSSNYFGYTAGLLALTMYVFDPTILAYSHYVTQDIGAALFFFLGYMSLLWVLRYPSWKLFVLHGVCMGLMAASKITTLPYYIVADCIIVPYILRGRIVSWFRTYPRYIIMSVGIFLLVIWSTYFFRFNVIVAPNNAQGRVSTYIRTIAVGKNLGMVVSALDVLEKQPVPLGDYIGVLKNTAVRSLKSQEVYFLGTTYPKSQWYFMVVTILLKSSLPLLILSVFGVYAGKTKRLMFLAPVISIIVVSSFSGMQPLIRYVLPLYPFLCIFAGAGFVATQSRMQKIILLVFILWHITGSLSFFPHFISYTNELAGNRNTVVMNFTDSNLDWGQSLPDLKKYIDTTNPSQVDFSYFGRDDASLYGLPSDFTYGSYRFNEICAFHDVLNPQGNGTHITAVSVTNWYACGYSLDPTYAIEKRKSVVGNSILIFE